jgi:hypothetical protein
MRAQDAIAWEPRKFRFFTTMDRVQAARILYQSVFAGVKTGAGLEHSGKESDKAISERATKASVDLLNLISNDPQMGHGQFSITDARLVSGAGDPPAFASAWVAHLSQVPHTLEQVLPEASSRSSVISSESGQLRWVQFSVTLWLPAGWKVPPGVHSETANCAE